MFWFIIEALVNKTKRGQAMSKVCAITGRGPMTGNNVSHSKRRTKRRWSVNLRKMRIWVPELNRFVTLVVSSKGLRIIDKLGPLQAMKQAGLVFKEAKV